MATRRPSSRSSKLCLRADRALRSILPLTHGQMYSSSRAYLFATFALAVLSRTSYAANATCYLRTGDIPDSPHEPCNPDAEVSHCCQKDKHICFSNKLCLDTAANHFIDKFKLTYMLPIVTDTPYKARVPTRLSTTLPVLNTAKVASSRSMAMFGNVITLMVSGLVASMYLTAPTISLFHKASSTTDDWTNRLPLSIYLLPTRLPTHCLQRL